MGQFFSALLRPISSAVKEMLIPVGRLKICGECAKAVFGGGGHLERGRSKYCAYGTGVGKGEIPGSFEMIVVVLVLSVARPLLCGCNALWRQNAVNL